MDSDNNYEDIYCPENGEYKDRYQGLYRLGLNTE